MRVVALVSGGKDSCYNMVQCVSAGHQIVALANLRPTPQTESQELDSHMFQTVGHTSLDQLALAMDLPLYRADITGSSLNTDRDYTVTDRDEVEDLHQLLKSVRDSAGIEAVSVGAILSDYQRVRVEDVCRRLGLTSLAFLWQRDQSELLREMVEEGMKSIIVKVACMGLDKQHLGKTLGEMEPTLRKLNNKFGMNVCGEGGEYETFTLDCPLFRKRLTIASQEVVYHSDVAFAPVSYLKMDLVLEEKDLPMGASQEELLQIAGITSSPETFIQDVLYLTNEELEKGFEVPALKMHKKNAAYAENGLGWFEIRDVCGPGNSPKECVKNAFDALTKSLETHRRSLSEVVRISMFVARMEDYKEMNDEYVTNFGLNPPVRVCVAVGREGLPQGVGVVLTVRGVLDERMCLHVQGVSHWAPANIGPYSQGVLAKGFVHVSGQIGLVPGSMTLISGNYSQACLALRHVDRVIKAMDPTSGIESAKQATCYVTDCDSAAAARAAWSASPGSECPLRMLRVTQLPRGASVEWEVVSGIEAEDVLSMS